MGPPSLTETSLCGAYLYRAPTPVASEVLKVRTAYGGRHWKGNLFEKLTYPRPVTKFSAFCAARMFVTLFTTAWHLFLSWAWKIQLTASHRISWRCILILPSYLCLRLRTSLSPSGFPPKPCMHLYCPRTCHMFRPSHYSWFDHPE